MAKLTQEEAIAKVTEGKGEFHVSTIEEHEAFLGNLKDTEIFKEQISGRVREIYQHIDSDVSGITGEEKESDEKTYDYVKRQLSKLTTNAKDLAAKKAELEKAVNDKSGDQALDLLRGELDSMKLKHQKYKEDADVKYGELEKSGVNMRVQGHLKDAMAGLKFKDAAIIPEDVRNAVVDNATSELAKIASFVEGKLVFLDGEGKIMRDENLNVKTAKDILSDKLKSIIDAGRKAEGVDIEDEITKDDDGKIVVNINLPDSVKTNVDLTAHLMSLGMKRDSEEYRAAYAKYIDKVKRI